jgi:hypothetical protein
MNIRGFDPPVIAQDPAHLALEERNLMIIGDSPAGSGVYIEKPLHHPAPQQGFGDDLRYIYDRNLLVKDLLGQDDHDGSTLA